MATGAERRLESMPSLLPAYARAVTGGLPGGSLLEKLPIIGGSGDAATLVLDGVRTDRDRLADYCHVCGFTLRETMPLTWPHVLSFPMQMALMSSEAFPFPLLGLVHIDDAITQHRPIGTGEALDLEVSAGELRPHAKGEAISLTVEARVAGELVWSERGTILRRGEGDPAASPDPGPPPLPGDAPITTEWKLADDLGRRYAAVSGDRNPIHLHALTARALGFPRPIAHGMWSMARCIAQFEGRLPDRTSASVRFMKPVLLPTRVGLAVAERDGDIGFQLAGVPREGEEAVRHLVGEASAAIV